jgi:glycosyltransferase involved in cell wall biosynthesis
MARMAHGIADDTTVLVGVGRGAPSKRFDLAIDVAAAARFRGCDVDLVVIGPGEMPNLRERAQVAGISDHVHLLDSRYGPDLAEAVGSADALISTSEYEGFGLTLVEGMACGLPVLAMRVGGVVDLVEDGVTGHLVPSGDVAAHADRVVELAADPALARSMGAAGRERVLDRFSVGAVARNFTHVYQELARR